MNFLSQKKSVVYVFLYIYHILFICNGILKYTLFPCKHTSLLSEPAYRELYYENNSFIT